MKLLIVLVGVACLVAYVWVNAGHDRWGWALVGYVLSNSYLLGRTKS